MHPHQLALVASRTLTAVGRRWLLLAMALPFTAGAQTSVPSPKKVQPIPFDQIGAAAEKQYHGDGLSVSATEDGARLRCVFQKLEGLATTQGLWLTSTEDASRGTRFRVIARMVGRGDATGVALPENGSVSVCGNAARFVRPAVEERYSVSMDGVRQDFLILERPEGDGELRLELDVAGARSEPLTLGARLVLEGSGRKIAYSRLRVTDAHDRDLPARIAVPSASLIAVVVDDTDATYPLRIDPTFIDEDWISMGDLWGANFYVIVTLVDDCENLYIGGRFTAVGTVLANCIAKWDGTSWSALASGMGGLGSQFLRVSALAALGSNLYAGGQFLTAGGNAATNIAMWDGTAWSPLRSGLNGQVNALETSGSNLFAGGEFTKSGNKLVNSVAMWNGGAWSALGSGVDGPVYAVAVSDSNMYAGGYFTNASGVTANSVAKWNGTSWSTLTNGIPREEGNALACVYALAVSGPNLYAGGNFTTAGGVGATNIAKWDGTTWSALGPGVNRLRDYDGPVWALAVSGSNLYAGGSFWTAGDNAATNIAMWNGHAWLPLRQGINSGGAVHSLTVSGSNLYVGGVFDTVDDNAISCIASWDGSAWWPLQSGINGDVYALALSRSDLYAGGYFTTAGGKQANHVAKWDGESWSALGSGIGGDIVYALAASDTELYAGGYFTTAGGIGATNIAKWDGTAWSALGPGMDKEVYALAVSGSSLYAGGCFTKAGNTNANFVAKWDGSNWSPLSSGMGGISYPCVRALAMSGGGLFAGGEFAIAGTTNANNIAKWDGALWSPLGPGVGGTVFALAASDTKLYAGGDFTTAGGVGATNVAMWNGTAWSPLGSGLNNSAFALATSGSHLFAGGRFTKAGRTNANRVAKWDGSEWSPLGSGMNAFYVGLNQITPRVPGVWGLAVSGTDLYVGSTFLTAGNKISPFVAKANLAVPTALEAWRLQYFGTKKNSDKAADASDPEGDGVENLTEFAFGMHPGQYDSPRLPLPARVGDTLSVTFDQPSGVDGITYGAEVSTDLLLWNPVDDTVIGTTHTFTYPVGSNDRLFMRLKVTEP